MALQQRETTNMKPSEVISLKGYLDLPLITLSLIFLADQPDQNPCEKCTSSIVHLGTGGLLDISRSSLPEDPSCFPLCSRVYYSGKAETSKNTFPSRRTVVIFSHENQDPEAIKNLPCGLMGKTT